MTEPPVSPLVPDPRREHPFGPEPRRLSPRAWRGVAIAAGVAVVLGLGVVGVLATQSHRLLDFALGQLQEEVDARLPESLPHAERERLAAAFEAARVAVRERRVGVAALRRVQDELLAPGREALTAVEVRELSEALEALGEGDHAAEPSGWVRRKPAEG
jgi:hypothetical protein